MLGETMAGWRTWDVMRAIDYLETREELDGKRIGCMGISGGGAVTLYATAVEPRIRPGLPSAARSVRFSRAYSLSPTASTIMCRGS